jgi:uncharacterized protein YecT (DUF1311 family)
LRLPLYLRLSLCAVIPIIAIIGTAAAADTDPCSGSADDAAMRSCRAEQLARSSESLTLALSQLRDSLAGSDEPKLKFLNEAQEAWDVFHEAECRLLTADSASGTAFDMYWSACLTSMNRKRLAEIETLISEP